MANEGPHRNYWAFCIIRVGLYYDKVAAMLTLNSSYSPSSSSSTDFSEKNDETSVHVLRDLNLTIEGGQKVAICGRTGR